MEERLTTTEIAARLVAKPTGEGKWSAQCPAHDDKRASLSVTAGGDGRTLLHCHAGCDVSGIVATVGLVIGDLFAAPLLTGRGRIDAVYHYTDEAGVELFQVVRFEPKDFRQRHRDPAGAWIWKMNGVRRVLYRLPEVLAAVSAGEPIWIVEGERDANSLSKLGLAATCNVGGAGKWRPEYTESLGGAARVTIIADRDEPGRKHAAEVARSLAGAGISAATAEVPVGKDASDWIAAGAGLGDFEGLATVRVSLEKPPRAGEPPTPEDSDAPPPSHGESDLLTESGLAEALVTRCGPDFRYVGAWKKWLAWSKGRWAIDTTGRVQREVKRTIREMRAEAARAGDKVRTDQLFKAEKRTSRDNIEALARHELVVQLDHHGLDSQPFLLNARNGTIDLRSGGLRPHRREDFLTKLAPVDYDPAADAPTWIAFLDRIFDHNADLIGFVQRAIGYSLTADVGEQCLFICWGSGANGKSTMLEALRAALGDYARAAPMDLFVASKGDRHPTELATLAGVRFAPCVETRDGARLNETLLKQLTGGDTVQARRMREDFWEFSPVAKLWLGTNHRPTIRGTDVAIWRRIRLIPFLVTIPPKDRDKDLLKKLGRELPGILRWAVDGCREWQRLGLAPPSEVTGAVDEYRAAEDRLAIFISERCLTGPGKQASHADIYAAFKEWADESGEFVLSGKAFSEQLTERGFESLRAGHGGAKNWRGIGLLADRVFDGDRLSVSPHSARAPEVNQITEHHRTPSDHECPCGASFECPVGGGCLCPGCGSPPLGGHRPFPNGEVRA